MTRNGVESADFNMSMPDWEEGVDGSARIQTHPEAVDERHLESSERRYLFGAVVVEANHQPEYANAQC